MYTINDLLDLSKTIAAPLFEGKTYPWEVLADINDYIIALGSTLPEEEYEKRGENVWIARDAEVFPSAYIGSPCIIDHGAQVRHCAFIRGSAIVGKNAVVGNSTELKNVILFDNVQTPHYNYVGDSILGYKAHMGAGSITSNVKSDKTLVVIKNGDELIETGRKKSALSSATALRSAATVYSIPERCSAAEQACIPHPVCEELSQRTVYTKQKTI